MATIRKLRGRWQAQVRRRGMKPRCKSFDTKTEAEKWARELEAQVDKFGAAPDTRILESTTLFRTFKGLIGVQGEVDKGRTAGVMIVPWFISEEDRDFANRQCEAVGIAAKKFRMEEERREVGEIINNSVFKSD